MTERSLVELQPGMLQLLRFLGPTCLFLFKKVSLDLLFIMPSVSSD